MRKPLVIAFIGALTLLGAGCDNSDLVTQLPVQNQDLQEKLVQSEKSKVFELQEKCSIDGKKYYQSFLTQNTDPSRTILWNDPEFHFNKKLNLCLIFIGSVDTTDSSALVFHEYQVIDIFSNKRLLYSFTSRKCNKGECNEDIIDSNYDVMSIGSNAFFQEKKTLMEQ